MVAGLKKSLYRFRCSPHATGSMQAGLKMLDYLTRTQYQDKNFTAGDRAAREDITAAGTIHVKDQKSYS